MNKKVKHVWMFLMFLVCTTAMAVVAMLLWNALIPAIFGEIVINLWQALGLLILPRILFGGFGFHHFRHFKGHHRHMHGMSRAERKEFILKHMQGHGFCGCNDIPKKESSENE